MRRSITIAAICFFAALLTALPANAACPASLTAPGTPTAWAFTIGDGYGAATVGVFILSVGPGRSGANTPNVYLVQSFDNYGNVQQETGLNNPNISSIYSVDPANTQFPSGPCAGQINIPGTVNALQLRFVLSPSGTEMFLASVNPIGNGPADHSTGRAVMLPSTNPGCGAGGNTSFTGSWSFLVHDYLQDATIGSIVTPDPYGGRAPAAGWSSMAVLESVADFPSDVQNYVHGSYKVTQDLNGNCFGGSLQFADGYRTYSFAYVYAGAPATASEIFMVDLGSSETSGVFGAAVRSPI